MAYTYPTPEEDREIMNLRPGEDRQNRAGRVADFLVRETEKVEFRRHVEDVALHIMKLAVHAVPAPPPTEIVGLNELVRQEILIRCLSRCMASVICTGDTSRGVAADENLVKVNMEYAGRLIAEECIKAMTMGTPVSFEEPKH